MLWNERNEITETSIANIVVDLDGNRYTPPVNCGCLPGTYRAWMLDRGTIEERVIAVEDMRRAERITLINSVRGERTAILRGE